MHGFIRDGSICEMTKENIIIAALRLFLLRGYKYVSLVDVANEVGITKGGIYHYFAGKEDLLHAAMHYLLDRFEAKYSEVFSDARSFRETLQAIIVERELDKFAYHLLNIDKADYLINLAIFALEIMKNFPEIHQRVHRSHEHLYHVLEDKVQQAMDEGEIRQDLDSGAVALIILTMLNGQNSLGTQLNNPDMRTQMMDNLWKLMA